MSADLIPTHPQDASALEVGVLFATLAGHAAEPCKVYGAWFVALLAKVQPTGRNVAALLRVSARTIAQLEVDRGNGPAEGEISIPNGSLEGASPEVTLAVRLVACAINDDDDMLEALAAAAVAPLAEDGYAPNVAAGAVAYLAHQVHVIVGHQ